MAIATYIADLNGSVGIRANDYLTTFTSQLTVRGSIEPVVQYQGTIVGLMLLEPVSIKNSNIGFPASLEVPTIQYNDPTVPGLPIPNATLNGIVGISAEMFLQDTPSQIRIAQRNTDYDIIDGMFTYEKEDLNTDILSTMDVRVLYGFDIDGTVDIQYDETINDINSFIEVKDIFYDKDAIEGSAYMDRSGYSIKLTDGRFIFEKEKLNVELLEGSVITNAFNSWFDVNCRINVPSHRILYSFLCKLKAVNQCTIDIPSSIDVFNDQIYDIPGELSLIQSVHDDLVLDGEMYLPPYYYCDIQSTVNMDPIYTRRDFDCYMYAATPVDTDIESSMNVETPYTKLTHDFKSTINVGNLLDIDFKSELTALAAIQSNNEFISKINVTNDLYPARVGIFVDPLWNYEPFVLKNAISTFFDRIMNKAEVSIVFSGSPRANWDIRHFADVYRIPKYHQHEVPFDFIPTHPLSNRDSMYRYINALFTFNPHSRIKSVDRVFIFSNNTYTHNSTYLSPLYKVCADYHIPLTVITSKGEFTGTDPASPSRYISRNPIDPNIPMDRQPHWVYGAGTKHRDIYDDHPIV